MILYVGFSSTYLCSMWLMEYPFPCLGIFYLFIIVDVGASLCVLQLIPRGPSSTSYPSSTRSSSGPEGILVTIRKQTQGQTNWATPHLFPLPWCLGLIPLSLVTSPRLGHRSKWREHIVGYKWCPKRIKE